MKPIIYAGFAILITGATLTAAESPVQAQAHKLFDQWDANKDGKLDSTELAKGLRGRGAQPIQHAENAKPGTEKHPDHVFMNKYDKDKDGVITREEFEVWERYVAAEQKRLQDQLRRAQHNRHHRY